MKVDMPSLSKTLTVRVCMCVRVCACVCVCVCVCVRTQRPAAVDVHGAQPHLSPHWPAAAVTSEPDLCPSEQLTPPPTPLRRQGDKERGDTFRIKSVET